MTFMQICNENYSTIKTIMLLKILEKSDLLDIQRSAMTHCNPQEILARPLEAQFVCRSNGYGVTQCQSWVCYKFHYVQKKSTILTNMKIFTSVLVQFGTYYFFLPGICTCISYLTKSKNTLFYPFFLKTHVLLE